MKTTEVLHQFYSIYADICDEMQAMMLVGYAVYFAWIIKFFFIGNFPCQLKKGCHPHPSPLDIVRFHIFFNFLSNSSIVILPWAIVHRRFGGTHMDSPTLSDVSNIETCHIFIASIHIASTMIVSIYRGKTAGRNSSNSIKTHFVLK